MTKRSVIIWSSVLLGIVALFTILFGVVFRVRKIEFSYADDFCYKTQINDIASCSGLKKGGMIFALDRDKVEKDIEKNFPYARVESVNITSLTKVEVKLSSRKPLYYQAENEKYYILDEDCKVLNIITDIEQAKQYILLNQVFNLGDTVEVGDFVKTGRAKVCTSLYNSLYSNAVLNIGGQDKYLEREDMCTYVKIIKFGQVAELNGKVDVIYLTTSYGCTISITEPSVNLDLKINMAFSALRTIIEQDATDGTNLQASGTIVVRYAYDVNGNITLKCEYHT